MNEGNNNRNSTLKPIPKIEGTPSYVPKSLAECMEYDTFAEQISNWSKRVEQFGKCIFIILIITGVILSITGSYVETTSSGYLSVYYDTEFSGSLFLTNIVTWGIYSLIEYCVYHAIALLLGALATIVQNTKVTASVSLYEANKEEQN